MKLESKESLINLLSLYYPANRIKQLLEVPGDEFTRGMCLGVLIGALPLNWHEQKPRKKGKQNGCKTYQC